jgi:hypothetical protein
MNEFWNLIVFGNFNDSIFNIFWILNDFWILNNIGILIDFWILKKNRTFIKFIYRKFDFFYKNIKRNRKTLVFKNRTVERKKTKIRIKRTFTWWAAAQLTATGFEGCASSRMCRPGSHIAPPVIRTHVNQNGRRSSSHINSMGRTSVT